MLGMEGEIELFKSWCDAVESMTAGAEPPTPQREAVCADFAAYVKDVVARRTAQPGDDLISAMVTSGNDEILEPFRRDPFPGIVPGDGAMGFIAFLVLAGSDTTRHAIAQGMKLLMERPDDMARLREQPELLPTAVDEILRFVCPVRAMRRTVMRDTSLRGRSLRTGQSVVMVYASANRDEEIFEDPESFRIDRTPNDHLSFGWGTHFCLGSNLARMEIRVAISRLLERLPGLRPEPDTTPTRYFSSILNGLDALPVVFEPQARGVTTRPRLP
jgi:cytochrome P450 family 142 subfamily A polypeptide 1